MSSYKGFLWGKWGSFGLFQLTGCLVVFFLVWARAAESEQGSPEMAFGDWLRRTIHSCNLCKVRSCSIFFNVPVLANSILSLSDSSLVWFYKGQSRDRTHVLLQF